MTRLPIDHGDYNVWGGILNGYLLTNHNSDGTHVLASTTAPGFIQLAGDLSGTAGAPTVPGLTAKENSANKGIPNGYASLDSTGKVPSSQIPMTTSPAPAMPTFSYNGPLALLTSDFTWYNDTGRAMTISAVRASVGVAPTGASVILDLLQNSTSMYTTTGNRPTIAIGARTTLATLPDTTTVGAGSYLTVNIVQVGSTLPGSDLVFTVVMS